MSEPDARDPAIIAFEKIRTDWLVFYTQVRQFLHGLDGDLSRGIGTVVMIILDAQESGETNNHDWPTVATAWFLKGDTELWHEIADSRKK
jgi:hypothetical protein